MISKESITTNLMMAFPSLADRAYFKKIGANRVLKLAKRGIELENEILDCKKKNSEHWEVSPHGHALRMTLKVITLKMKLNRRIFRLN